MATILKIDEWFKPKVFAGSSSYKCQELILFVAIQDSKLSLKSLGLGLSIGQHKQTEYVNFGSREL